MWAQIIPTSIFFENMKNLWTAFAAYGFPRGTPKLSALGLPFLWGTP